LEQVYAKLSNSFRLLLRPLRADHYKLALAVIFVLLALTAASALALRGYFAPTSEFEAFEIPTDQLTTVFSFSAIDNVSLPTNNFTILYNPQSQNTTVTGDTFFGSFSYVNTTAVAFQEGTNIDATKHPYFEVSVTTSPDFTATSGFAFGLRFVSRLTDGSVVLLWNDALPTVEHVRSGGTTILKAYVPNYNQNLANITGIRLYAEERGGVHSDYKIRVNSITASRLNSVQACSSQFCYVPIALPNNLGFFDTMVTDTIFTGQSNYKIAFSYQNQTYVSRAYLNGSSHVSLTAGSQNVTLQNVVLASTPLLGSAVYIMSSTLPTSIQVEDLRLTFTPVPNSVNDTLVPQGTNLVLLLATLILVFAVPAELLMLRVRWKFAIAAGIIARVAMMPWTGHRLDTLSYIRDAYLYYHQGWGPIFYNPPTVVALAAPIGSMQFYYLLGLDRIDTVFLFHYGGVIATFFVKLPFLLADLACAGVIAKVSPHKTYSLYYFLNPFSIFVSAIWGQYEGLTALALITGYVAIVKLRPWQASFVGLGAIALSGLVELFGFLAVPFLAIYMVIKKYYIQFALCISTVTLVLLIPSSVSQFIFSFNGSNPFLQPDIYSLSGNLGISSQLPLVAAITASASFGLYHLIRTSDFIGTLIPISATIISLELFAHNLPQFMLIPLGLITLLFAIRNDIDGLMFVWFCGALLAFITIAAAESFAYLLTGEGYYIIPLVEGGQHLKFYAVSLLVIDSGLLIRTYKKLPFLQLSILLIALIALGWFLVNLV